MISTSKSHIRRDLLHRTGSMDLLRKSNGKLDKEKAKALYSKMKEIIWVEKEPQLRRKSVFIQPP